MTAIHVVITDNGVKPPMPIWAFTDANKALEFAELLDDEAPNDEHYVETLPVIN